MVADTSALIKAWGCGVDGGEPRLVTTTPITASASSIDTLGAASNIKATPAFTLPHTSSDDNHSIASRLLRSPPTQATSFETGSSQDWIQTVRY
ncbi:hypothetical protein QJS10_CPB20g00638 [Acorus calamus]|uniref:Uncharacterized protein n=1 Tax=Acorus calamus TaxID=4465 RepID=A0AAV9C8R2_ACOCL|nr:hypothetical protein QJS10_CPB20g00638 [Acorus calamus]